MHQFTRAAATAVLSIALLSVAAGCTSGRLGEAILEGDTQEVQRLLDEGADPNRSFVSTDFAGIFLYGDLDVVRDVPFLTTAVELGEVDIARALLEAGADPNNITDAPSPLYSAGRQDWRVIGGDLVEPIRREAQLTRLLLEYGADPNLITHPALGSAPIHVVSELETMLILFPITDDRWYTEQLVSNRRQHSFGPLVSALTDMRRRREYPFTTHSLDAFPPLTQAVLLNDESQLSALLAESTTVVDERDRYGFTPLMWAASRVGDPQFVQPLIDAGADVNAVGDGQWTALLAAIEADHPQVIEVLCAEGADPDHRIHYQRPRPSPLMLAAQYRHVGTFRALLDAGADPLAEQVEQYSRWGLLDAAGVNRTEDAEEIKALATAAVHAAQEQAHPTRP